MIRVITSISYDSGLLTHWIPYYLRLGADRFTINIADEKDGIYEEVRALVNEKRWPVDLLLTRLNASASASTWSAWIDSNKEFTRKALANETKWIIPADIDEFIQFPLPLNVLINQMQACGTQYVPGTLVDRIANDGSLPALKPDTPIWSQYPLECDLTRKLIKGCTAKVTLAEAAGPLGIGHHRAPSLLPFKQFSVVHHFKWREGILRALETRRRRYSSIGRPRMAKEAQSFLDHFAQNGRINITDFNCRLGWNPDP